MAAGEKQSQYSELENSQILDSLSTGEKSSEATHLKTAELLNEANKIINKYPARVGELDTPLEEMRARIQKEYQDVYNETRNVLKSEMLITREELKEITKEMDQFVSQDSNNTIARRFQTQKKALQKSSAASNNRFLKKYIKNEIGEIQHGYRSDVTDYLIAIGENDSNKQKSSLDRIKANPEFSHSYIIGNIDDDFPLLEIKDAQNLITNTPLFKDIPIEILKNYLKYLSESNTATPEKLIQVFGISKLNELKILVDREDYSMLQSMVLQSGIQEHLSANRIVGEIKDILVDAMDPKDITQSVFLEYPEQILKISDQQQLISLLNYANTQLEKGRNIKSGVFLLKNISPLLRNNTRVLQNITLKNTDITLLGQDFISENIGFFMSKFTSLKYDFINYILTNNLHENIQDRGVLGYIRDIYKNKKSKLSIAAQLVLQKTEKGNHIRAGDTRELYDENSFINILQNLELGINNNHESINRSIFNRIQQQGLSKEHMSLLLENNYQGLISGALDFGYNAPAIHKKTLLLLLDKNPQSYFLLAKNTRADKDVITALVHSSQRGSLADYLQYIPLDNINDILFLFQQYTIEQKGKMDILEIYTPQIQSLLSSALQNTKAVPVEAGYKPILEQVLQLIQPIKDLKDAKKNINAQQKTLNTKRTPESWIKEYTSYLPQILQEVSLNEGDQKSLSGILYQYLEGGKTPDIIFGIIMKRFPNKGVDIINGLKTIKIDQERKEVLRQQSSISINSQISNIPSIPDISKYIKVFGPISKNSTKNDIKKLVDGYMEYKNISADMYDVTFNLFRIEGEQILIDIDKKLAKSKEGRKILESIYSGKNFDKKAYEEMMQTSFLEIQEAEKEKNQNINKQKKTKIERERNNTPMLLVEKGIHFSAERNTITQGNTIVPLSDQDQAMILAQPEIAEKIIDTYQVFQEVGITKLWKYSREIFQAVSNKPGQNFNLKDGDYIGKNELFIVLNSLLTASGEEKIKSKNMNEFITAFERKNNVQYSGNEAQTGYMGYTKIEDMIINKYADIDGNLGFKQSEFETAIA